MTAQRDKLDAALAEIDAILGESGPRLPWVMSNDVQQQRQMLAKARELLAELRQEQADENSSGGQAVVPAAEAFSADPTAVASSQVLKALLEEMQYLRGQTMQILDPLRNEVTILKQQRELLLQEVQQLQQQLLQMGPGTPPSPSAGQWEEMLQQLTSHLEAHLSQQLQQSVQQLETSAANTYLLTQSSDADGEAQTSLSPAQRLEYLKQIQSQSDHLVLNLDRVLRTVFDSLQQSVYSYQDSLSHGLNKMHTLGQQGEMMFNALINHLAQQMNQDTLAYLEASQTRATRPRQLPEVASVPSLDNGERVASLVPEVDPGEPSEDWNFDDMELDLELNDDEVTLLQIDDEISQLQLDPEGLAVVYDPTRDPDAEPSPAEGEMATAGSEPLGEFSDPLQVLDRLDEAIPDPASTVSLPESLQADTLEAAGISAGPGDEGDAALDDLYQSIFGNIIATPSPTEVNEPGANPGQSDAPADLADGLDMPGVPLASGGEAPFPGDDFSDESFPSEEFAAAAMVENESLAADLAQVAALLNDEAATDGGDEAMPMPFEGAASAPDDTPLDELFGEGIAQQLTEASAAPPDATGEDVITSLDDLLAEPQADAGYDASNFASLAEEPDGAEGEADLWSTETDFIAAASDEDLLTSDDLPPAKRYWLTVDPEIRDQLDEDLSDLESRASAEFPTSMSSDAPEETLEDFAGFAATPEAVYPAEPELELGFSNPEGSENNASTVWESSPVAEALPEASPLTETVEDAFGGWGDASATPPQADFLSADETVVDVFGEWGTIGEDFARTSLPEAAPPAMDSSILSPQEDLWSSPPEVSSYPLDREPASLDDNSLDNRFAAFGEDIPSGSPPREAVYQDQVPPYPFSPAPAPSSTAEHQVIVEDTPMPIGDLPSQESIEALLSDLNLSLGPDEPAVGESGLTLDALDALATPPVDPGRSVRASKEPTLPPFLSSPAQPRPQPVDPTSPQPVERPQVSDPSLTLENLLGELKLDPLFPDSFPAEPAPGVTVENVFGADPQETPAPVPEAELGETGLDVFGEPPSPDLPATRFSGTGANSTEGFGEGGNQAPFGTSPMGTGGIDLFGEAPLAEPAPEGSAPRGVDLFGEFPAAEPVPGQPDFDGVDRFGEVLPAAPALGEAEPGGIDLFGEAPGSAPPPVQPEVVGVDLFDPIPVSAPAPTEPEAGGIDLFGEVLPPFPGADSPQAAEGIDLFGETAPDVEPYGYEESSLVTEGPGAPEPTLAWTETDDLPPISLDDLDLSLGSEEPGFSPEGQGESLPQGDGALPAAGEDLFGVAFEPKFLDSPQPDLTATVGELFGDGAEDAEIKALVDEAIEPFRLEAPESTQDLFGESFGGQPRELSGGDTPADEETGEPESVEALFGDGPIAGASGSAQAELTETAGDLFDDGFGEAQVEPIPPAPIEMKYSEWLSDISLENILGTAAAQPQPSPPAIAEETVAEETVEPFLEGIDGAATTEPLSPMTADEIAVLPAEADFLNLDALLDESFGAREEATENWDEAFSLEEIGPRQTFENEVNFIDLDALLDDRREAASLPPMVEFELPMAPAEDDGLIPEAPLDLTNPQDRTPETQAEWEFADDLEPETRVELSSPNEGADAPEVEVFDLPLEAGEVELPPSAIAPPEEIELAVVEEWVEADEALGGDQAGFDLEIPEALTGPAPGVVIPESAGEWTTEAAFATLPTVGDGWSQTPASIEPEAVEPPFTAAPVEAEATALWFLGLDIGAQGVSAVLLQRHSGQVYPLYWVDNRISGATADKFFRLPAIASVGPGGQGYPVQAVGSSALMVNWEEGDSPEEESSLLKSLKPFLKMGVPLTAGETADSQPMIQWSDATQLPLQTFQNALQGLLTTLLQPLGLDSPLTVGAIGLEPEDIAAALQDLQGVVVSYPANWPDTYPFNVREAVIQAGLIDRPDDIYFLEDAIAAVLSGLPDPAEPAPTANGQPVQQQTLYACHWTGGTVVISAGATVTEMGLANLPPTLGSLSYQDFVLHSMSYAGDAIDLDIICHLLHPAERRQPRNPDRYRGFSNTEGWSWQTAMPEVEAARWDDLDLDRLEFPRAAEPDLTRRYRLQQRLESSLLGQSLLEAVRHLKIILQHQPQFELELADQRWIVRSKDLEDRIILPYIQRINGHLNKLLSEVGLTTQGINQVICTGGSASLPKISRWLRQKFPNATIIQDTYHSDRPPSCSRVAYGLVNLLRYPQVLDLTRHQYSDMFLLMELLRTFPDQPMPLSGILHLLKERGINTEACELHLIALLEGRLPPGLLPATHNPLMACADDDADLQALVTTPLFSRPTNQVYVPNPEQGRRLRAYMEALLGDKYQTLRDPLLARLASVTV